jgi:DNA repair exonuclease SbcCD ATPase subunit
MPRAKRSTPAPAPTSPTDVLSALRALESSQELSFLKLSEPIISADTAAIPKDASGAQQRTSDVSNSSLDAPTPGSLEADLTHYRELFAKLRFSYVEQVTKEKFIRAIVGDPPLIVSSQENVELEAQNAAAKSELKTLKTEVADMVAELERRGKELARRYENLRLEKARLEELPDKIKGLEQRVDELRRENEGRLDTENPELNLPLAKTADLVSQKKRRSEELDRQLEQLKTQLPRKRKELERLQTELVPLEAKRASSTAAAKEAKRRKEAALGGVEDDLEERGRWYRAAEAGLRQMLEI